MKAITKEMTEALNRPLPPEAIKPHPTRPYLSVINYIYVTQRLNEVFGVGSWRTIVEHETTVGKMVVVKLTLEIPEYGVFYQEYGGNDNADHGDAYKGAVTDALTKICAFMGIGAHVWRNDPTGERDEIIKRIEIAESVEELTLLWKTMPKQFQSDPNITSKFTAAKNGMTKGGGK